MRGLKDSYDDMSFTPPLLATITAHTLIVQGDRDPLYPVELALRCIAQSHRRAVGRAERRTRPIFGALAAPFVETAIAH